MMMRGGDEEQEQQQVWLLGWRQGGRESDDERRRRRRKGGGRRAAGLGVPTATPQGPVPAPVRSVPRVPGGGVELPELLGSVGQGIGGGREVGAVPRGMAGDPRLIWSQVAAGRMPRGTPGPPPLPSSAAGAVALSAGIRRFRKGR
jgi:hypothetical protein